MPVVLQMTDTDCGAACLAMVLRHAGVRASLAGCRERLGVGRDGVSALALLDAARELGLRASAYRATPEDLASLPMPLIAHWEGSHFVVVERRTRHGFSMVDPALGRRTVPFAEAAEFLTGTVLVFTGRATAPGPAGRAGAARTPWLRRGYRLARGFLPALGTVLSVSVALQLLGLALPLAMSTALDAILPARETGLLPYLGLAVLALALTQFGLAHLRSMLLVNLQSRVDRELMTRLFAHLMSLPFRFFQQRSSGDLMQRLASSVLLREIVTTQVLTAAIDGALVLGYLAVLFAADTGFAVVALGIGLIQVCAVAAVNRRLLRLNHRQLTVQAEAESVLIEALSGIATIKSMGAEKQVYDHWLGRYSAALAVDRARSRLSSTVDNVAATVRLVGPLALLWLGMYRIFADGMSLGDAMGLQMLALAVIAPLGSLVASAQVLQSVASTVQRLRDVFSARPEIEDPSRLLSPTLRGKVEVRGLSFRYDGTGPYVLRDVSFTVQPGRTVAVVGASGSGKSTLAMLLTGLYRPSGGQVLLDGVPLERIAPDALRRQFGVVFQESYLFRDSIRRNIALARPDLPMADVRRVARLAAIDTDVEAMPLRYDTRVAERGQALSGGQRQRLAIARALAGEPVVLLLDEATSHLDVATERRVSQAVAALRCAQIVIAHRLSTVRHADEILVLDGGTVAERGSHDELLALGGRYAALVRAQLDGQAADAAAEVVRGSAGAPVEHEPVVTGGSHR